MKPTLRKFCRTIYKQYIKLATELTYRKHRNANHADILHKSKDNAEKEQLQATTESRSDEDDKIIPNT